MLKMISDAARPSTPPVFHLTKSLLCITALSLWASHSSAQLSNGSESVAHIDPAGDIDSWVISARAGDTILLRTGERNGTDFEPRLQIVDPDAAVQANSWDYASSAVSHQAAQTGNYTLRILDASNPGDGIGEYQLYYGKIPGSFVVPAGDEGGDLSNGGIHPASIKLGDLDIWTIDLEARQTLLVQAGQDTDIDFEPQLTIYGPTGNSLATNWDYSSSALSYQPLVSGRYTVVVTDGSSDAYGLGDYTLYATAITGDYAVEAGDEGGALLNGTLHTGNIPLADIDTWTIDLDAGDSLSASVAEISGSDFEPQLSLYDSVGNQLTSNWNYTSAAIHHQVDTAGQYTLTVRDASSDGFGSGAYQLHVVSTVTVPHTPAGDEGGSLSSGDVINGSLSEADQDAWTIQIDANDTLVVQLAELSGTDLEPQLRLYDPLGNQIATNWDYAEAQLVKQVALAGTYTLIVQDASGDAAGNGDYRLHYVRLPEAQTVASGDEGGNAATGINNGVITSGDIDVWTFSADHLDTLVAQVIDTDASALNPSFHLYDPEGNDIAGSWDYDSVSINQQLPIAGTYYLVVRDSGGKADHTGNYTLNFSLVQDNTGVPSGSVLATLTNGGRVDGLYDIDGDIDKFDLPVSGGSKVVLSLAERNGNSGSIVPHLQVFSGSGDLIAEASSGTLASTYFTAASSDTLRVVVRNGGAGLGEYQLYYAVSAAPYSVPVDDQGGLLTNGQRTTGVLPRGDLDLYSLAVNAGNIVRIKLAEDSGNSGSVVPWLRVFTASGALLAETYDGVSAELYFEATSTEQLMVLVSNNGSSEMNYEMNVAVSGQAYSTAEGDEGNTLANGIWQTGTLLRGDIDLFELQVLAGDTYSVRLGELGAANSGSVIPRLEVFGSDGSLYQSTSGGTNTEVTLRATKNEALRVVVSNSGTAVADYELQASVASRSFTTVPGDEGGGLTPAASKFGTVSRGDLDLYTIAVTAGDEIGLSMIEQGGNSGSMSPHLRIYRSDGSLMAYGEGGTQADLAFRALTTENLLVMASNSGSATGDYELLVTGAGSDPDGDLDGLSDSEEASEGTSVTNPDTDGDQMPDGYEVANGLNPLVNDSAGDLDDDGISNLDEYLASTDPGAGGLPGDANNDGIVNLTDLLLVQKHLLAITLLDAAAVTRCDVYPADSPDGVVDLSDMLQMTSNLL